MLKMEFTTNEKNRLSFEKLNNVNPRIRRKTDVVWLKSNNLPHQEIARLVGVTENTVRNYLYQYRDGGIDRLCEVRYSQPVSELDKYEDRITDHFIENPPATAAEARSMIIELTGIERSLTQVRQFMKRIGMRHLRTGVLPGKADPKKQEDFKNNELEPPLREARAGERIVYFMDAAHFVFSSYIGIVWCFVRCWIKSPAGRKRFNVLGAINAITHEVITITNTTYINSESVCQLLHCIAERTTGIPITLILDNARYQRCALVQSLAKTLNIDLLFLPTYSPNLNLIERLWKFVKKKCLYAKYYPDFNSFTTAITTCLANTKTIHREALQSLLRLNFQSFQNIKNLKT